MQGIIQSQQSTEPVSFIQSDFSGGMNLFDDDTKISNTEYRESFNIRNRGGIISPTTSPNLLDAPAGLKQGIYGFDTFFVLFVAGKAYYQVVGTDTWINLSGFQMSTTALVIYAQAVPASNVNYGRALQNATTFQGTNLNTGINLLQNISINGLPAGLVCQDGVNQPWIIFADKSSRVLQTYAQWTLAAREYVPIGKQMAYMDGILFIVAADSKAFYRSVSGRPIDFGVNIDISGMISGDATTVSGAVSYNNITTLYPLNSGQLLVGTTLGCFPVTLDFSSLVFGEPTFDIAPALATGCVNHFSVQDILGDYAIVDYSAILSFNAVQQLKNEGRNDVFSLKISSAIKGLVQDPEKVCSCIYDNYLFVSLKTVYGYAIVVYDTIKKCWVSLDITPEPIIMLTTATIQTQPRVFGISSDSVYEFYPLGGDSAYSIFRPGASTTNDCRKQLRTQGFRCVFYGSDDTSSAVVTELMDDRKGKSITLPLTNTFGGILYPVSYPVYFNSLSKINNIYFNFEQFRQIGWKLSAFISWGNQAKLIQLQVDAELDTCKVSNQQQTSIYAS